MAYTAQSMWYVAPPGTVVVEGGPATVVLTFSLQGYTVTFLASGLPAGMAWTVTVSPREGSITSVQPAITFNLTNGSYSYFVSTNSTSIRPQSQVVYFDVPGRGFTLGVQFWRVFPVVISENGLTAGTGWGVDSDFSGANSTTSQLTFYLPNGTAYVWVQPPPGYVGNPSAEYITVEGTGVSSAITFSIAPGWYPVTFTETGLPNGTAWGLAFDWQPQLFTNSTSLTAPAPNGSIPFQVVSPSGYTVKPTSGSVQVNGAPTSVNLAFSGYVSSYRVTFTESGIPAKALANYGWAVELNGAVNRSFTSTVSFPGLPNGTYSLLLRGPSGYTASGSGTLSVSGATSVLAKFTKAKTAMVRFSEKGLPKGQSWCVAVDGDPQCSTTSSVKYANLTAGSYHYAVVSPLTGQNITARMGTTSVSVSGMLDLTKSTVIALTFAYRYAVTFTETGLTSGTWSVTVKGVRLSNPSGAPIVFHLVNGTYSYKIGTETGYTSAGTPKPVKANGTGVSVTVKFTPKRGYVPADFPEGAFDGVALAAVPLLRTPTLIAGRSDRWIGQ